ncbi:hypothetical protein LV84_01313 [Algoriphagus ratkowskyi]|uniref:Uncharacterized protein n=1 Tax=Algoriphagus ratkowskyi TaxID=57028 RepID=A0A2W7REE9_9BACT|nr:hypothetical protein LV84_01313 [Algoriphagus ratkowskyi]
MDELFQYIACRIKRLKKSNSLITFTFLLVGVGIITWKYSYYSAITTVFIFTSALTLFDLILNLKFYLYPLKKKSSFDKGQKLFTWILIAIIVVIQCILWNRRITILTIGIGLTYAVVLKIILFYKSIFR